MNTHAIHTPPGSFALWHSVIGTGVLLLAELVVFHIPMHTSAREIVLLAGAAIGALVTIYVATEAIEEVRGRTHMFTILTIVMLQFILFFAFEYWFLCVISPLSFPNLALDPITLLLHSVMIFVFNPLYLPATLAGRGLLLINTFGSLALVLFVLQNIGELRRKSLDGFQKSKARTNLS